MDEFSGGVHSLITYMLFFVTAAHLANKIALNLACGLHRIPFVKITESLLKSILGLLFVLTVQVPTAVWATKTKTICTAAFSPDRKFSGVVFNDEPLAPEVTKTLGEFNIPRSNLFDWFERSHFRLDSPVDVVVGYAHATPPTEGLLIDPSSRGTVVNSAESAISSEKTEKLYVELEKAGTSGDILMASTDDLDEDMLAQLDHDGISHPRMNDGFHLVDDQVFLKYFVKRVKNQTRIPDEQATYLHEVLTKMVESARVAQGPHYQKKINGIRIRWKDKGMANADTIHTDRMSSIATTLALIGAGTEVFYQGEDNTLEVRGVPTNYIAHILGESSGRPAVRHRASTLPGKRIVLLIFWN